MEDRAVEQEDFDKKLTGKKVTWVGYVSKVAHHSSRSSTSVVLYFQLSKNAVLPITLVIFDDNEYWNRKLFSLRKNDKVMVEAIFVEGSRQMGPLLKGFSLELLKSTEKQRAE